MCDLAGRHWRGILGSAPRYLRIPDDVDIKPATFGRLGAAIEYVPASDGRVERLKDGTAEVMRSMHQPMDHEHILEVLSVLDHVPHDAD